MMARLRAKLDGDLRRGSLYIADVTQPLPVAEASQDAVVAVHIFHLIDAVQALHQIRRILKTHGALIWGYTDHDPTAPQRRIRPKFNEFAADRAGEDERYFFVPQARQFLADWGAKVTSHTVASWSGSSTPRRALESIADKEHSSTWHIPEEAVAEALRRTEAWAVAEYGDLDRAYTYEDRFQVDWYQF
jgi:SAM-dependent methyltransferase